MTHPYHSTIRVLSSALQKLNDRYLELEDNLRKQEDRQTLQREQAENRVKALKPPIRDDIARRILQAVFEVDLDAPPDDQTQEITLDGPAPDDDVSNYCNSSELAALLTPLVPQALFDSIQQAMTETFSPLRTPAGSIPKRGSLFFSKVSSPPRLDNPVVTPPDEGSEIHSPSSPTSGLFDRNGTIKSSATSMKSSKSERSFPSETKDKDLAKEKSGIGDWVGGWWSGQRRKRTQSSITTDSASVFSDQLDAEPGSEGHRRASVTPATPATPDLADQTIKKDGKDTAVAGVSTFRKMSHARGMFSALGLGSSASSAPAETLVPENMIASPSSQTEHPPLPIPSTAISPPSIYESSTAASVTGSRAPSILSSLVAASDSTQAQRRPVASPSHLRAIFNSTRIMTSDASSVLVNGGALAGELVKTLAFNLIRNARDQGLDLDDKRAAALRGAVVKQNGEDAESVHSPDIDSIVISLTRPPTKTEGSAATSLAAATLGQPRANPPASRLGPSISTKSNRLSTMAALASPLIGAFASRPTKTTDKSKVGTGTSTPVNAGSAPAAPGPAPSTQSARPGTVELESIHPALSRPPTLFLTRSALSSSSFKPTFPHSTASRFSVTGDGIRRPTDEEPLLTDRYGFIYDVSSYYVNMLVKAKEASSTAPSSFTGVKVKELDEDDDDTDGSNGSKSKQDMEVIRGHCESCEGSQAGSGEASDQDADMSSSFAEAQSFAADEAMSKSEISAMSPSSRSARLPATLTSALSPSKPSVSLTASSLGGADSRRRISDSSEAPIAAPSPTHACSTTVSLLLSQLTEIHDKQQATQKTDWDVFLKKRKFKAAKTLSTTAGGLAPTSSTSTSRAAALFGLGIFGEDEEVAHSEGLIGVAQMGRSANKEDWKEFSKLVRSGIPLRYRPKVWLECSGALEMMEPGVYQELLSTHEGQTNTVLTEIEKDVSRTMPLNIFFGGDGVGVSKLRRVLQAYSW